MTHPVFPANNAGLGAIVATESMSLAMLNAVARQQSDAITAQAVTVMAVATMLSITTAEIASTEAAVAATATVGSAAQDAPAVEAEPATVEAATATTDMIADAEATEDIAEAAARMIAQTVALTVQDTANYLRNVQTLSTASIACGLLQANTPNLVSEDAPALSATLSIVDHSTAQFERLCGWATEILAQLRSLRSATGASEAHAGESPAAAAGLLQAAAHALSTAVQNAVACQQQVNITAQAATTMGVATLYSLDTASTGVAAKKILDGGQFDAQQLEPATPAA
jgi:hypothetical protein